MAFLRRISALALAGSLAATAACDGDSSGSGDDTRGSLSFSYSGAVSGSFSASGKYEDLGGGDFERTSPLAVGIRYFDDAEGEDFIDLFTYRPRTSTTGDFADIFFADVSSSQTISMDLDACLRNDFTLNPGCAVGFFGFNGDYDDPNSSNWITVTGELKVTSVSNSNLRGTFSGTLENLDTQQTITVTNGKFDVPLVDEADLPNFSRTPAPRTHRLPAELAARAAKALRAQR